MPHKCVRCGKIYPDGSSELLKGCTDCNSKFFFFVKKKDIEEADKIIGSLSDDDKTQIEQDVYDIIGIEEDIIELFKGKPLVYRVEEGKYIIDLASTFGTKKKD